MEPRFENEEWRFSNVYRTQQNPDIISIFAIFADSYCKIDATIPGLFASIFVHRLVGGKSIK
jgi:hypothetical protein